MASVTISKAVKAYGAIKVLHGVDIEVEDGSFVILVGPSGCGKSTLLRMIAGLESVSGGEICIGDQIVNDMPPKDRDIAMVFQNYALYPHMNVRRNMGFSLELKNVKQDEIDRNVMRAANILGLENLLDRLPRQLSGGQRQRVAMGRAIVRDPQVFLFDEPLSNLDAKLRVAMRGEIKALHQRLKTTTIYVTHDQVEAMTMADKIVVMRDGEVAQAGTPLELFDRPANVFVAGFIGSPAMNLLTLTVSADSTAALTSDRPGAPGLPLPPGAGLVPGNSVVYGIRPEFIELAPGCIPGDVIITEPTGSETTLSIDVGGHHLTCLVRHRIIVNAGDSIDLRIDPANVHLFDPATGLRI